MTFELDAAYETDLLGGASDSRAMPLDKFTGEVTQIPKAQPEVTEICVEKVKPLRFAAGSGHYDSVFRGLNAATASVSH